MDASWIPRAKTPGVMFDVAHLDYMGSLQKEYVDTVNYLLQTYPGIKVFITFKAFDQYKVYNVKRERGTAISQINGKNLMIIPYVGLGNIPMEFHGYEARR